MSARYGWEREEFCIRPFLDPAKCTGSEAEKMAAFREVRDGIAAEVTRMLAL